MPTRAAAEKISKILGCRGAHRMGDQWAPCPTHEDLVFLIENGSAEYRERVKRRRGAKVRYILDSALADIASQEQKTSTARTERFMTRSDAERRASEIGCVGSHRIGQGVWAPCEDAETLNAHRGTKNRSTRLPRYARTRPQQIIMRKPRSRGVETIPGGGLVSGKNN